MTDHSILTTSTGDLPFRKEARAITNVLGTLFVDLPNAFASALRAKHLYDELHVMDSAGLQALGISREGIGRYAVENSGLIVRQR